MNQPQQNTKSDNTHADNNCGPHCDCQNKFYAWTTNNICCREQGYWVS